MQFVLRNIVGDMLLAGVVTYGTKKASKRHYLKAKFGEMQRRFEGEDQRIPPTFSYPFLLTLANCAEWITVKNEE
ncbi:MAG: hypothetical protein HZC41_14890 [Chloroflexi bacterium]|nr:hypothetical protein [Chloroflexota bacterium]